MITIPTDIERLKIVIIPESLVMSDLEKEKSLTMIALDVLASLDEGPTPQVRLPVSIMIPSFCFKAEFDLVDLLGE